MKIKIILNGTEELVAALEQKSKSDFVAVCNRTVGLLTREATRNTPADTGKLRQSIRTELPKESDMDKVSASFSEIEKKNVDALQAYSKSHGWS